MNNIQLIVGLCNPGKKYEKTRHNIGCLYVKAIAKLYGNIFKENKKLLGYTSFISFKKKYIHLLIPNTYMNHSGDAVIKFINLYNISIDKILVAHDEIYLKPGVIKLKKSGGHGGHNGIKDIQLKLKNNINFYRLRIGIGLPENKKQLAEFVLDEPSVVDQYLINKSIEKALHCTEMIINHDINKAIMKINSFKADYIN